MAVTWTTQRSGNWSVPSNIASSPWYDGSTQTALARTPGSASNANNDLVILANGWTLTADQSVTIGDATTPSNLAISNPSGGTGVLNVSTGVALTVVSNVVTRGAVTWTISAGASIYFNSSSALTWTWAETGVVTRLLFSGTSNSHITVSSIGSGKGRFTYTGGAATTGSNFDATYVDFTSIGDSSNSAILLYLAATTARLVLQNCTFTSCGNIQINQTGAAGYMVIDSNKWYSTVASRCLIPAASQARTTGTRIIRNNGFDAVFGLSSSLQDWTIQGNAILGDWSLVASSAIPWAEFSNNFIAHPTSTAGKTIPGVMDWSNPWNYFHFHSNSGTQGYHGLSPSSFLTGSNVRFGGMILEPGDTDSGGDYIFVPSTATATNIYYRNILFLPTKNGIKAGSFFSFVGPQTNTTVYIDHCTFPTDGLGETGIHWGETYKGRPGMIASLQSNLAWGYNAGNANLVQTLATGGGSTTVTTNGSSSTVTGTGTKWLTGNNVGGDQQTLAVGEWIRIGTQPTAYQVASVASDTSLTVTGTPPAATAATWTPLVKDVATTVDYNAKLYPYAGTDGAGYNSGSSVFTMFTTPPGTHDVTLGGDPFVAKTRNIATWIVDRGQVSGAVSYNAKVTAAYAYLKEDPANRIADLVAYVKEGFRVKDPTLLNAGHDGTTIGAVPYLPTPVVPSPSHIHTWFNEPIAVKSGNATYYGIYTDTGVLGVGRYDHAKQIYEVGHPRADLSPIQVDDHNNPAVLPLSNGKILAAYAEHPGKSWAAISNAADSVTGGWTETQLYDGSTYHQSYAHLAQTDDDQKTIWWFFREGVNVSNAMPITFRINQNGGAGGSWTANGSTVKLVANGTQRPYFRIAKSGRRIDILYTDGHPTEVSTNSLYHVYLVVNTAGTQYSLYKGDGTLIDTFPIAGGTGVVNGTTLPISTTTGTKIYDGATSKCWIWDVQWVGGTLYACYPTFSTTTNTDDTHKYRRATYNGSTWTHEDVCYAGDSLTPSTVGRVPHWIYPDAATSGETRYSPGICLDPNTADRVYLGKKYGDGDVRIQQWDKSGGNWSKTSDLTGASGNGKVNARPFPVQGSSPSQVIWFTANPYTNYTSFTTRQPGLLVPPTLRRLYKPTTPVYAGASAPRGTKAYYLMSEGLGTAVADVTGSYPGTITGGPLTWNQDEYGPSLSGFSSTIAVVADSLASSGFFDGGTFPKWIGILYKSTAATTGQYLVGFGNSGSTNPIFGATVNNSADNQAGGNYRDAANVQNQVSVAKARDLGYHTLLIVAESASSFRAFGDANYLGAATNATGAVTFDRFTIGALRRATQGSPASGATISAVVAGSGSYPSPIHIHCDFMSGQFLGTYSLGSVSSAPICVILLGGRAS
jgi:hypothetical protein